MNTTHNHPKSYQTYICFSITKFKRSKKGFLFILALCLCACFLAACGNSRPARTPGYVPLAYLLKSHGLLDGDVEEVLDCYFRACSIQVDCRALAHIGAVLSNRGRLPVSNQRIFPSALARYVNAILMTCGMYDGSGEFAMRVGVPAKSGVGGGIMAVVPTRMGIGIYSPALDSKGNSMAGIHLLERLSKELYLSIF